MDEVAPTSACLVDASSLAASMPPYGTRNGPFGGDCQAARIRVYGAEVRIGRKAGWEFALTRRRLPSRPSAGSGEFPETPPGLGVIDDHVLATACCEPARLGLIDIVLAPTIDRHEDPKKWPKTIFTQFPCLLCVVEISRGRSGILTSSGTALMFTAGSPPGPPCQGVGGPVWGSVVHAWLALGNRAELLCQAELRATADRARSAVRVTVT